MIFQLGHLPRAKGRRQPAELNKLGLFWCLESQASIPALLVSSEPSFSVVEPSRCLEKLSPQVKRQDLFLVRK
ncbi:hypothetical protein GQ55_6G026500 [Panicum hallii var. hallii]|uniref:Uncharacterized protein n=1 Tax=Panicum hallii var. hallii TaxID=1504633 RepID=A0A2T7D339_9POAL|nr:hypothetical protein GQ55_6G026500 [Panicum hallii var. hallii]